VTHIQADTLWNSVAEENLKSQRAAEETSRQQGSRKKPSQMTSTICATHHLIRLGLSQGINKLRKGRGVKVLDFNCTWRRVRKHVYLSGF